MSDKKVTIRFETVGADSITAAAKKASEEIGKVSESVKKLGEANKDLDGGGRGLEMAKESVGELNSKVEQLSTSWNKVTSETSKLREDIEGSSRQTGELGEGLNKVANEKRAKVLESVAGGIQKVGDSLREAAEEFREGSPQIAEDLAKTAKGMDILSTALNGAATGFAVGGPFGAAVGGLISAAIIPASDEFENMIISLSGASEAQARAAEMTKKLADAHSGSMEAYFEAEENSERLATAYKREREALEDLNGSMQRRNSIASAEKRATAAWYDRDDARRIRNGEDPEIVKKRKVNREATEDIEEIDQTLSHKREIVSNVKNNLKNAEVEKEALRLDGKSTSEQKAAQDQRIVEWKEELKKAEDDLSLAERVAVHNKRTIRERAGAKVEDLDYQLKKRKDREQRRNQSRTNAERSDLVLQPEKTPTPEEIATQSAIGREGLSLIPEGTDKRLRDAIEMAATGLQNGDQGGEMEDFLSLIEKLAETVSQSGKKGNSLEGRIQQLTSKISILQDQVSQMNGR